MPGTETEIIVDGYAMKELEIKESPEGELLSRICIDVEQYGQHVNVYAYLDNGLTLLLKNKIKQGVRVRASLFRVVHKIFSKEGEILRTELYRARNIDVI